MHLYFCKDCGAQASVADGVVVRTCTHANSIIIAERTCNLLGEGHGSAETASLWERGIAAIAQIMKAFHAAQQR